MKFSFIIRSIDRYEDLDVCIASIKRAHEFAKSADTEILVIFNDEYGKSRFTGSGYSSLVKSYTVKDIGLSEGRNIGIKKSAGQYYIFIDDDAAVKEDFLSVLAKNIAEKKSDAFCGRLMDTKNDRCFAECYENDKAKRLNRLDFKYFRGSAIVLSKSAVERVGLFDVMFGLGARYFAAEDSDMFFRLMRRKMNVVYLPDLVFFHPVPGAVTSSKVFNYSYAIGAMLAKQMLAKKRYVPIYLSITSDIISKSFLRSLQTILFYESIKAKDEKCHYKHALMGTIKGLFEYTRDRMFLKKDRGLREDII